MAKKKKKLEEDAWMWMSQPSIPGMMRNPFFEYSFEAISPSPSVRGTAAEEGRSWGTDVSRDTGFLDALLYYTIGALLDPKNPVIDAKIAAAAFGVTWWKGLGIAAIIGAPIGGLILTGIDPQHKWSGGLDESRIYQAGEGGVAGSHPNLNKEILFGAGSWGSVV